MDKDIIQSTTIESKLSLKTGQERAEIKSAEISKLDCSGKHTKDDITIEIIGEVKQIFVNGQSGVEVFARGWRADKQLGFSQDGSVEIERFRIFNPPILVDDPNGTIDVEFEKPDKTIGHRFLREDPIEAIRQSVSHTISVVGKERSELIKGKTGNTTDTFYPDTGDGLIRKTDASAWATAHDATSGTFDSAASSYVESRNTDTGAYSIARYFAVFDTSTLGTDSVDSATFTVYSHSNNKYLSGTAELHNVYSSTCQNTIDGTDFDLCGTTAFCDTGISSASWAASGSANDFAFNTSGLAGINKTGKSKFSLRNTDYDVNNTAPPGSPNYRYIGFYASSQTGTANDPKLVVVHSAVATGNPAFLMNFL